MVPAILAASALIGGWAVWRRLQRPYYPDIALQAGLELLSRRRRVLAIGPHPGDLECFVGGTLKLLAQNGSSVTMAVLSRGERATNRANIAEIRTREAEAGATVLSADLIQLDLPDGQIRPGPVLDHALEELWQRVQPDVVVAFDPKGPLPFGSNPDHLALGASVLARVRKAVSAGERVYFYGSPSPNVLVDITEVVQEKETGLRAHRSQLRGPDEVARFWTRLVSRIHSGATPAMYTEGLFRLA